MMDISSECPRVAIIILNWNGWRDTLECLESVYKIDYPNYDVVVVDNGSTDNSIEKIKEYCSGNIMVKSKFFKYDPTNKPIKIFEICEDDAVKGKFNKKLYEKYDINRRSILIKNRKNYGFTGGNNIAIKFAIKVLDPDYILLLNNDTAVNKNFLIELIKVAELDDRIGILQSKILKKDNPNIIDSAGIFIKLGRHITRGSDEIDRGQYDDKPIIDAASGTACLFKCEMLKDVGLFEEDFFAYHEDTELSLRARKYGWIIKFVSNSVVFHKGHATSKVNSRFILNKFGYKMTIISWRNLMITINKHGDYIQKILFWINFIRIIFMSWVGKRLGRNNIGATPYIIAFREFLKYKRGEKYERYVL